MTKAPGAPDIMPPEALEKDCQYNCKIDIFSFGVLSVYMITQDYPETSNSGITPDHVLAKEIEVGKRIQHINEVASKCPGTGSIVRTCLQDLPERRPQASQLKNEFEDLCK